MTFAISLIAISLIAWLMVRTEISARPVNTASPGSNEAVDGAIACARESLARGDVTAAEYERIVSVLRD